MSFCRYAKDIIIISNKNNKLFFNHFVLHAFISLFTYDHKRVFDHVVERPPTSWLVGAKAMGGDELVLKEACAWVCAIKTDA